MTIKIVLLLFKPHRSHIFSGNVEKLFTDGHALFIQTVLIRSEIVLSADLIKQALDFLYNRHPLLRMRIVNYNNNLYFTPMEEKNIDFQVIKPFHITSRICISNTVKSRVLLSDVQSQ